MEDHQNPLRFETSPYHNVVIKDRKSMELSGVAVMRHVPVVQPASR